MAHNTLMLVAQLGTPFDAHCLAHQAGPVGERMGEPPAATGLYSRRCAPLTEPAARSPPSVTIPLALPQGPDRPGLGATRGQSLALPAGWSPDMVASPERGRGVYLSDVPVYWPLPSPQGLRGPSNFQLRP